MTPAEHNIRAALVAALQRHGDHAYAWDETGWTPEEEG